jgi:S-adenosylmethionine:tRNA ribosyltransferase-isomerase
MRLDDFDYDLPETLIAQHPVEPRDAARLLVDRGSSGPAHRHVRDLPDLLQPGDLLVVNESKVLPARLRLQRASGGAVEILLLDPLDDLMRGWEALAKPARKLKAGEVLFATDGTAVIEIGQRQAGADTVLISMLGEQPMAVLQSHGEMPLPPYIRARLDNPERYQTVYAAQPGSAAAPTAGLHFTKSLLDELDLRGVERGAVELVVGLDTFQPVTHHDPRQHQMHSERYAVPADLLERCRDARRVVAVGTTSVRALESAASTGRLSGRTSIFIHRSYEWRVVDLMMTNFHLPRTTLLMMIDAFVGYRWRTLYDAAMADGYRFLSFGDAMLLDRKAA